MNYLIIGRSTDISITFLNFFVIKSLNNYFVIDPSEYSDYLKVDTLKMKNLINIKKEINMTNIESILKENKIDAVVNFHELKVGSKEELNKINYEFVVDLYNLLDKYNIEYLLHISTTKVYGNSNYTYRNERDRLISTCDYTESKINSDLFLLEKSNVGIMRVAEVFGCLHDNNFLNKIIKDALYMEKITIIEEISFIRSYTDVYDIIYFVNHFMSFKITGVYNVASEYFLDAKTLIYRVLDKLGCSKEIDFKENKDVILTSVKECTLKLMTSFDYIIKKQDKKLNFYLDKVRDNQFYFVSDMLDE